MSVSIGKVWDLLTFLDGFEESEKLLVKLISDVLKLCFECKRLCLKASKPRRGLEALIRAL